MDINFFFFFPSFKENNDEELQFFEQEEEERKNIVHDEYDLKFLCVHCKAEERYDGVLRESGEIGLICPKVNFKLMKNFFYFYIFCIFLDEF